MRNEIIKILEEMGVVFSPKNKTANRSLGQYVHDDYALYVQIKKGKAENQILVDSHLDHPGFVIGPKNSALALGSVGWNRIKNLLNEDIPMPIKVFDFEGNYFGTSKITNEISANKPFYQLADEKPLPINGHAIWDVNLYEENDSQVEMYSADNMIVTCVMLSLIENLMSNAQDFDDVNIVFAFTYLEEIFEVSASAIANRASTPFGKITQDTIIFVLESMQCTPLLESEIANFKDIEAWENFRVEHDDLIYSPADRESAYANKKLHPLYSELDLPAPNHEDGILIKINDVDGIYGMHFGDSENLAEHFLVSTLDQQKKEYQLTLSGGACNGTAYSIFPLTSHIATIVVPNKYKHNMDHSGHVVSEVVKIEDVNNVFEALLGILKKDNFEHPEAPTLSKVLKNKIKADKSITKKIRVERESVAWASKARLSYGKYFPSSNLEKILFYFRSGFARVRQMLATKL
jgi:hypothetical protein